MENEAAVTGSIHAATEAGFVALLKSANRAEEKGYHVLGIVSLGDKIAALYRRKDQPKISANLTGE